MRPNHVLRAWRNGEQTVGAWLSIDSAFSAEAMAHAGFDWLCIDMQHGIADYPVCVSMLQAISTTKTIPFVRVPGNEPSIIMRVLDAGAYGVVVPLVDNKQEAERAVAAMRYPPAGGRSSGPARAAMYGGPGYQSWANDEIACIVMIETAEGIEKLDEILSVPGVDAAYIGPSDLAYAIGLQPTGDNNEPTHVATVDRILEACKRHGVAPGIHTGSVEFTTRYLKQGFQMVTLGSELGFMRKEAVTALAAARGGANVGALEPDA